MKRIAIILVIITVFSSCLVKNKSMATHEKSSPINSDPDYFAIIPNDFLGVYLPFEYIEYIKKTKNHSQAIHSENAKYHNLLIVRKDIIYSDLKWHDGYAIKKSDNQHFQYLIEDSQYVIIDNNGYRYKRISKDLDHPYKEIDKYIAAIILKPIVRFDKVKLIDNQVKIKNIMYEICLDDMFFPKDNNLIIYNYDKNIVLGIQIKDNIYYFYKLIPEEDGPFDKNSGQIIYQIKTN